MPRTPRENRERFEFSAIYDDSDDRLHIHRTTISEFKTSGRNYWIIDGRETERNWLVLRRTEFLLLVTEGWGAVNFQVRLLREGGVRVGRDESVFATRPITVREEN